MDNHPSTADATAPVVLAGYSDLDDAVVRPLEGGLVNRSFAVESGTARFVLQRLHRVFAPEIHHNIDAVTRELERQGVPTPKLVPTTLGELWLLDDHGFVWRLMTRLPGRSYDRFADPHHVHGAAIALARFHAALRDIDHTFVGVRDGVHDTAAHLTRLQMAVDQAADHRLHDSVAPLCDAISNAADSLPALQGRNDRVVHGDPKVSNLLFADQGPDSAAVGEPVGWVDLDTVGRGRLGVELGDAWRSWCNPHREDDDLSFFSMDFFRAAIHGYASACGELDARERHDLVHGVEWISLELAARFATDALAESYFGWDRKRYPAAGEHNLARARAQWRVYRSAVQSGTERAALIAAALR